MAKARLLGSTLTFCALVVCALAAAHASASGLTAVACEETPGIGIYEESHCSTPTAGKGDFETVPIAEAEFESEAVGETRLIIPIGFNAIVVTCTAFRSTGSLADVEEEGEMRVHGTTPGFRYSGCVAAVKTNTAPKCEVENLVGTPTKGILTTPPLTFRTGTEHRVTFTPEGTENFFKFKILPGACQGATITITAPGSLVGITSTTTHSHITFQSPGNLGSLTYEATHVSKLATPGLKAVACKEVTKGTGTYTNSHCETPQTAEGGWDTVKLPLGEPTGIEMEGVVGSMLKGTVQGTKLEITCETMHSGGELENIEKGGVPVAQGSGIVLHYTGCRASRQNKTAFPCEVESITGEAGNKGTIATKPLALATGALHGVTLSPEEGSVIAEFKVVGSFCLEKSATVKVEGTLVGLASTETHSHVTFTAETTGAGLKINEASATFEGTNVTKMAGTEETVGLEEDVRTLGLETF